MKPFILFYSSLLIMMSATQCRKQETSYGPTVYNPGNITIDSTRTFLALGDSYTIGQSVSIQERFPTQTVALLKAAGINMAEPEYVATTGWTTDNLSAAIVDRNIRGPYSIVTLLIGVNDQYQRHDTSGYRIRFRDLLFRSINFAGNNRERVFVLSIPDYSVTPFASFSDTAFIREQINWFNAINKEETIAAFCHYLDITPSTRQALYDPTLIANDGLHPSGKEYAKWAAWLAPEMKLVLR